MKKVLVILGAILLVIGITGCAVSAATTAPFLTNEQFYEKYGDSLQSEHKNFAGKLDTLDINVISAAIEIKYSDEDKIGVDYIAQVPGVSCDISYDEKSGRLKIYERSNIFISFFIFNRGNSKLIVTIPEIYMEEAVDEVKFTLTSGTVSGELPRCDKLAMSFTSGKATDITIDCDYADFDITSGLLSVINRGDKMKNVELTATSGNVKFYDFAADTSRYDVTSGDISATGLSGKVSLDKTSGRTELEFAELDGDVEIDSTSGDTHIILPYDAGFDLEFDRTGGNCKINTPVGDGKVTSVNLTDDTKMHVGGEGNSKIIVDVTSGDTAIDFMEEETE